jgi:hypothetical protein
MRNKYRGRKPTNPQLAQTLHNMEPGETIKILGGDAAEIRRTVGSLNRTIKRKDVCLSYRRGSGNRSYITCLRNVEPKTFHFHDFEQGRQPSVQEIEELVRGFLTRKFPGITVTL